MGSIEIVDCGFRPLSHGFFFLNIAAPCKAAAKAARRRGPSQGERIWTLLEEEVS
jgi:hypothetical protein